MAKLAKLFTPGLYPADLLLVRYLVHACAYYDHDQPLIADHDYDQLAAALATYWWAVQHPHKQLIDVRALRSGGSAYYLTRRFPRVVDSVARHLINKQQRSKQ